MIEIWKDAPGLWGILEVSNLGRVRRGSKILHGHDNGKGYLYVAIRMGDKQKHFYVHRLVASAFVPNPGRKKVVDHIDYDRGNNRAVNLRWVSVEENVRHSARNMRADRRHYPATNTGERYIFMNRSGYFVLQFQRRDFRFVKYYTNLADAVRARNGILEAAG